MMLEDAVGCPKHPGGRGGVIRWASHIGMERKGEPYSFGVA